GEPPFPDKNPLRKFVRHATEKPRPIRELNPAVPEKLEALIQRMLAKDPVQRPATPQIAADALRPFLAAPNAKKAAATTPAPPTQQPVVLPPMPAPVRNMRPTLAPAARSTERPAPVQQAETPKPAPRRVVAVLAEEEAAAEQPVAAPAADEQPSTRRDVRLIL